MREVAPGREERALREGDVHLIIVPTMPPTYRFDPAREESRTARLVVDDALKRAAGRADPWTAREKSRSRSPGSRYIDWLIPGLVGLGIMSTGMWGIGFSDRAGAHAQGAQAAGRHARCGERDYLGRRCSRAWCSSRPKSRCR